MFINSKPIEQIDQDDLKRLIDDEVYENTNIDYKSQLEFTTVGKNDLLATCSAMANTNGGDILYGITEKRDDQGQPMGLPESIEGIVMDNWDKIKLRIEQIITDYIQPHIQGIEINHIQCINPDRYVVVVRIPPSLYSPHMTFMDKCTRFYRRNSAGNQIMDVNEIGRAFLKTAELYDKAKAFRDERIKGIHGDVLLRPVVLNGGAKIFIHVVPLYNQVIVDFTVKENDKLCLLPLGTSGCDRRMNIDGRLCFDISGNGCSYAQLFRDGKIEYCYNKPLSSQEHYLSAKYYEDRIILCVKDAIQYYANLGISFPIIVYVSLLGVRDYRIKTSDNIFDPKFTFERDELYLPEILIENNTQDIVTLVKYPFDVLWNAGGYRRCFNYDEDGNRVQ